jgi:hypothetical protein
LHLEEDTTLTHKKAMEPVSVSSREDLLKELHTLPGSRVLERILQHENALEMVGKLSLQDFFWLIKKIGEEDCLPLLELASLKQWQYLLDLEIWTKDRLDESQTAAWLKRLQQADPKRLAWWLFNEGASLGYLHFLKNVEVAVVDTEDEAYTLPDGFSSVDGVLHIRVKDSEHREYVEDMLRAMASADFDRYQAFFLELGTVLPAETEEEMYRLRTVRLAEQGFLPFEEAVSVYAPLNPEALTASPEPKALSDTPSDEETEPAVPVLPLVHAGAGTLLTEATRRIADPFLLDRIRIEFAGLCNQILSADNRLVGDLETLIGTCRKAAGYINLALERGCGKDIPLAENILRDHPLLSIFRVGFGLALKLKWEIERWLKESWFYRSGLSLRFWGDYWGGTLAGLLTRIPRRYVGLQGEEDYADFGNLSELGECLQILRQVMVIDGLLERLAFRYPPQSLRSGPPEQTFRALLFNFWARQVLKLQPGFSPLTLEEAKGFIRTVRREEKTPPYRMKKAGQTFIEDLMSHAPSSDPEASSVLHDTLSLIWGQFCQDYERVEEDDLDPRYSKFISILPDP